MMADSMMATPSHCIADTDSPSMILDISTATGSSAELMIELRPTPVFGIPIAKNIGGITVPKSASGIPHFQSPAVMAPFQMKVGGKITKIRIQAPVSIKALLCSGLSALPIRPLTSKKIA